MISFRVVQGEVDFRVLADRVAEIPHAEIQVMGQHLSVLLPPQGSPSRRPLRILRALNVLKSIEREWKRVNIAVNRIRYRINYTKLIIIKQHLRESFTARVVYKSNEYLRQCILLFVTA